MKGWLEAAYDPRGLLRLTVGFAFACCLKHKIQTQVVGPFWPAFNCMRCGSDTSVSPLQFATQQISNMLTGKTKVTYLSPVDRLSDLSNSSSSDPNYISAQYQSRRPVECFFIICLEKFCLGNTSQCVYHARNKLTHMLLNDPRYIRLGFALGRRVIQVSWSATTNCF